MSASKVAAIVLACAVAGVCGCDDKARRSGPRTEGETIITEGKLKREQGRMMTEGEAMVVAGRSRKAKGDALIEQGRRIEGAREARQGELLIRRGEAMIEVAREMETEIAPTTGPSSD